MAQVTLRKVVKFYDTAEHAEANGTDGLQLLSSVGTGPNHTLTKGAGGGGGWEERACRPQSSLRTLM